MTPIRLRFLCGSAHKNISKPFLLTILFFGLVVSVSSQPSFITPDTVCVGTPVPITNTSVGATNYYWNFCAADLITTPTGVNLGNIGGLFSAPVFMDYAYQNGVYYGFSTNYNPGKLVRLNFGNSLLNTPTATDLGNFGGHLPTGAGSEGIQLVFNENKWYAIIVAGWTGSGYQPRIIKIDFGANLNNNSPVSTNWGNLGNMSQPIDLHVFQEGNNWYGLTVNAENNTITRFNFTSSFNNTPTAVNLGNIGNLAYPTGIYAINDNGFWRVFVVNGGDNTRITGTYSLTRLDFGSSLLNTPTGVNLGNPGNLLRHPRDLTIMKSCGQILGFAVNGHESNSNIIRFDFNNNLSSVPVVSSLGTIGNVNFPHSISRLFRQGADIYGFITNAAGNSLTRLRFTGCFNSNVPSSTQQNPAPVTYNIPGTYYINLTINDGLPTQNAFCRKVVVIPPPAKSPNQQVSLCSGSSVKIGSPILSAGYVWSTGSTSDSITITSPGTYWVESSRFGCSVRDSFIVSGMPNTLDFSYSVNSCNPKVIQFNTNLAGNPNITWNFGDGQIISNNPNPINTYNSFGTYSVTLTAPNNSGCNESVVKTVSVNAAYTNALIFNSDTSICPGDSVLLQTSPNTFNNCWTVSQGPLPSGNYVYPQSTTTYTLFNQLKGSNIVVNGNFENGNTGFTSQYIYNSASGFNSGVYNTGSSITAWHPGMANCQDHTSGTGKMLMVNGADQLNVNVWTQTIPVQPNTNYVFSTWIQNISFLNPAQLQFSINGSPIGTIFTANAQSCIWEQFYTTWNSGTATSAQIAILNMNSAFSGNDFALDDIFFGSVTQQIDSFTVFVGGACDSLSISGPETICSLTDTVSYSVFRDNCNQPFTVNVDNAYAQVVSQTPDQVKFIFKKAGNTTIKLEINNSCVSYTDSINISIKISPNSIDLGPDLVTCRDTSLTLHAGYGFETYQWQNGTTDSILLVTSPGTYSILAQNYCGASISDNFTLNKVQPAPFLVSPLDANVCIGDSVAFTASGGDEFLWSPAPNFNAPNTGLTKALIDFTGQISVQITDNVCIRDTTIMIPVAVTDKADIQVTKTNDVNCSIDTTILTATGGDNYTWSASPYITRTNNGIITVKPPVTTTFYVSGTNASGCSGEDSITVEFSKTGDQKLYMPNAFTPNRDGLNDIYKAAFIGPYRQFDFSIFNRWGELVFRSRSPDKGWDGTYKGKLQSGDVFVYYITAEGGCDGKFVQKGTFVLIR